MDPTADITDTAQKPKRIKKVATVLAAAAAIFGGSYAAVKVASRNKA